MSTQLRDDAPDVRSTAPPTERGASPSAATVEVDIRDLLRPFAVYGRAMAVGGVLGILLGAAAFPFLPRTYTASVAFIVESRSASPLPNALGGVASQLGLSLGGDAGQSPRFYSELVTTRTILEPLLRLRAGGEGASGPTLQEQLDAGGRSPADSVDRAVLALRRQFDVGFDHQTNIIRVGVSLPSAQLAAATAEGIVRELNHFNADKRQTRGRARREYLEARMASVAQELGAAERAVKDFAERNRGWEQSPALRLEESRLRRAVSVKQAVYETVAREYESARLEERNDQPLISVVEAPVPPTRPSSPRLPVTLAAGALVGALASVGLLALRQRRPPDRDRRPQA